MVEIVQGYRLVRFEMISMPRWFSFTAEHPKLLSQAKLISHIALQLAGRAGSGKEGLALFVKKKLHWSLHYFVHLESRSRACASDEISENTLISKQPAALYLCPCQSGQWFASAWVAPLRSA